MSTVLDNSRISKHLGQVSEYKSTYDPTLLVSEPRSNNREHLNISDDDLPFVGFDTWNAYEVSALTFDGLPVAGVAKIVYPCNSKYIVESKSIKLYFNSFNMHQCGNTMPEVLSNIQHHAIHDLSKLLETEVDVFIVPSSLANTLETKPIFGERYKTLEDILDVDNERFEVYQEDPDLLTFEKVEGNINGKYIEHLHSSLLKSNCRVTSQPDWGDVYIYMKGDYSTSPNRMSMLKYIVSFRDECHFHEEICETVYARLMDKYQPEELCVTCLYARRGGIDINPSRASSYDILPTVLSNTVMIHHKTGKQ